jgi:hypothetical protein
LLSLLSDTAVIFTMLPRGMSLGFSNSNPHRVRGQQTRAAW